MKTNAWNFYVLVDSVALFSLQFLLPSYAALAIRWEEEELLSSGFDHAEASVIAREGRRNVVSPLGISKGHLREIL